MSTRFFKQKLISKNNENNVFWYGADMLAELCRREKEANIIPHPDIDVFMKARERHHCLLGICFTYLFMHRMANNIVLGIVTYNAQAVATEGQKANLAVDYILKVKLTHL